jgi:hypothetical protein
MVEENLKIKTKNKGVWGGGWGRVRHLIWIPALQNAHTEAHVTYICTHMQLPRSQTQIETIHPR